MNVDNAVKRPKSNVRKRQALVAVRLLPEEHERLVTAAASRGTSLAEVVRQAVLRELPA